MKTSPWFTSFQSMGRESKRLLTSCNPSTNSHECNLGYGRRGICEGGCQHGSETGQLMNVNSGSRLRHLADKPLSRKIMLIKKPIITWLSFFQVGSWGKLAAPPHELSGRVGGWCGRQAQEQHLLIIGHKFLSTGFLLRVGLVRADLSMGTVGASPIVNKSVYTSSKIWRKHEYYPAWVIFVFMGEYNFKCVCIFFNGGR